MISRIAGLAAAVATITAVTTGSAVAAPQPECQTATVRPCVWQQPSTEGVVGAARLDTTDHTRPALLRVEVRIQRAWGRPWETVAASSLIGTGNLALTTPAVRTDYRAIVCATGGPADRPDLQNTTCTV